ncbi:MAG: nucleotide exchange factor GrpE [Deltaproteobacteria bacterium]|jgi:molecular chaperone GrpE|nr:nucleotide exchange factor GrpE [Deltaproteobacteria bacterium]
MTDYYQNGGDGDGWGPVPPEDAGAEAEASAEEPLGAPDAEEEAPDWEREREEMKERLLRALAENENARRRHEKELASARKYSSEPILRDIVSVLENLYLALSYADRDDPKVTALAEGVSLTVKDCLNKLSEYGFKEIAANPGDPFDPTFQEALGQEPNPSLPNGSVARVLSRGYLFYDRLLKPLKVNLVKNAEEG